MKKPFQIPRDWTFKTSGVANHFDRHVREQLPWYELTTGVIAHVARHYIPEGGLVYDIGASTGNVATVLWRLALAGKVAAGADARDVIAKELSLSGVQRPLHPDELTGAVEIFRFGDFAGWIIEHDSTPC